MSSTQLKAEPRIIIIEDDIPLVKFLSRELKRRHFQVDVCSDGKQACAALKEPSYDLAILDLNLPDVDGMDILKEVRAARPELAILVLTARKGADDLVEGFERGADDYLVKPFSFKELLARVHSLLRRRPAAAQEAQVQIADLTMDRVGHAVFRGGRRIELTPREFDILEYLMNRAGKVVTRKDLMEGVWRVPYDPSTNIVDVYLKYVRDKINSKGDAKLIRTVRGVGYVLNNDQPQPH
jgi:DNA-binding response OmpR family regulator